MALAGVGKSYAQPPMMPSNGNPDQVGLGMLPSPYNTSYGPAQQYYPGQGSAGYPPGANAWPNISPFAGPPVDSTAYEDGFWYNRILQGNRKYYFSAEALLAHTQIGPPVLIGAQGVNPVSVDAIQNSATGTTTGTGAASTGILGGGTTQFNQTVFTTGPYRYITGGSGGTGGTGGTGTSGNPTIFGSQDTGVLGNIMTSGGFRGTWGWVNPDDTGFEASGFVQGTATSNWSLYDPLLDINQYSGNYNPLLHLHAWFGLPLGDSGTTSTVTNLGATSALTPGTGPIGDTDGDGKYGAVQPYDMGVYVRFTSQLMGANADWLFNPVYEQSAIRIRPLVGAKYVHLQEKFSFDGYDSGLGYTVNSPNTGTSGTGGGGATGTTTTGYLTPATLDPLFSVPNVLHSQLISSDISNMAGPEAGFRLDLGKRDAKFQVWTNTKAGALANVTTRQVSGFNIGNAFNIVTPNTVPAMPNDPNTTAFSNSKTSTTLSPMFEQSINVKFPIFNVVPYLNKMEIFERAKIQAGYTFLYIGDVYRPQNTIIWNQYPKTPQLNGTTSSFYNSNFSLGVEWVY